MRCRIEGCPREVGEGAPLPEFHVSRTEGRCFIHYREWVDQRWEVFNEAYIARTTAYGMEPPTTQPPIGEYLTTQVQTVVEAPGLQAQVRTLLPVDGEQVFYVPNFFYRAAENRRKYLLKKGERACTCSGCLYG